MFKEAFIASCLTASIAVPAFAQVPPASSATYTYRWTTGPTAPVANPTDWITITGGNRSVKLTNMSICGSASVQGIVNIFLTKTNIVDTGGSSGAAISTNFDSSQTSPTATVLVYTANPTVSGTNRAFDVQMLNIGPGAGCLYLNYGTEEAGNPTVRGTSQQLAVNFGGATLPAGATFTFRVETIEQ